MLVTRTLYADTPPELLAICRLTGFLRADLWRRFGGLRTVGETLHSLRRQITQQGYYAALPLDGTLRNETTKDILNDILTYKAAAKAHVRQAIAARTNEETERKRLYTALKTDRWLTDNFLHRQMRQHFKHGRSQGSQQCIIRADRFSTAVVDGQLTITLHMAKKYGADIVLTTTSSGKNVRLAQRNLRLVLKNGRTEIHYAHEKVKTRDCGTQTIGVDKGYTEALVDSDGAAYGLAFGAVLSAYSDTVAATGRARNRLHALEQQHRDAGRLEKAERIRQHNLGRCKLNARRERTRAQLRTLAYQAAHALVDKAALVVSEDLFAPMAAHWPWKRFNRRMSAWAKGVLAEALESVCTLRGAKHALVNPAYTSQMDSITGLLEGKRVGDRFYRVTGDVLQADHNAARNVLARYDDPAITRYTPFTEVRRILLARSPAQLSVKRLELEANACQPSADKS